MKQISITQLNDALYSIKCAKKKNGNFIARKSFFYRQGLTTEVFVAAVKAKFPLKIVDKSYDIEVMDCGQVWKPFKGGASIEKQSHWYVEFKLLETLN